MVKKKKKTKNSNKSSVVIKKMDFEKISNSQIRFFPGPNLIRDNEIPLQVKVSIEEPAFLGGKSNILSYGKDGFWHSNIINYHTSIKTK